MTFTEPLVPSVQLIVQKMINTFGTAGTIAIAVIGGAVVLGILVVLARYGWGLLQGWIFYIDSRRPENADQYYD